MIDVDELSEDEIAAVLETPAFQKSLKYRRLAQGIEVLEDDDAIYRQLVDLVDEGHSWKDVWERLEVAYDPVSQAAFEESCREEGTWNGE